MLIVAAENMPFVREAFARLGDVRVLAKDEITNAAVRDAELLLVRSTVKVNRELLEGSRVRFVGTATIGFDHVDLDYLRSRGITFASAPGCNAQSVAEYVCAALLVLEERGTLTLKGSTLGVVGVGNVGTRVARVAGTLGMETLLNDPPRERAEGNGFFTTLDELCNQADVVTFHVPLERGGRDPTWHMTDDGLLAKLKPATVLLNTSRGAVADTEALKRARRGGNLAALVLDVYENEPGIDPEIVSLADIATPHVAGYSYDGRVAGTRMIHEAACRFLGVKPAWPGDLPPEEMLEVKLARPNVLDSVRAAYDIERDDAALREIMRGGSSEERASAFARYRKEYRRRREFSNWNVLLDKAARPVRNTLERLGFRVVVTAEEATTDEHRVSRPLRRFAARQPPLKGGLGGAEGAERL